MSGKQKRLSALSDNAIFQTFRRASSRMSAKLSGYGKITGEDDGKEIDEEESNLNIKLEDSTLIDPDPTPGPEKPSIMARIGRRIIYFLLGLIISTLLLFGAIHSQSLFDQWVTWVISSSIGSILALILAINKPFRCIMCLTLPQLTTNHGRIVILSIITGMLIGGPFANILYNANQASESVKCFKGAFENVSSIDGNSTTEVRGRHARKDKGFEPKYYLRVSDLEVTSHQGSNSKFPFRDIYQNFKGAIYILTQIFKYLFFASILILPFGAWSYLRKIRSKKGSKVKRRKLNLLINLSILCFHFLLSMIVVGFDWMLFWLEESGSAQSESVNQHRKFEINVNITYDLHIDTFPEKHSVFNDTLHHPLSESYDLPLDIGKCLPVPRRPRGGFGQIVLLLSLYLVVFVCIFLGIYSPRMKFGIVKRFYPEIKDDAEDGKSGNKLRGKGFDY